MCPGSYGNEAPMNIVSRPCNESHINCITNNDTHTHTHTHTWHTVALLEVHFPCFPPQYHIQRSLFCIWPSTCLCFAVNARVTQTTSATSLQSSNDIHGLAGCRSHTPCLSLKARHLVFIFIVLPSLVNEKSIITFISQSCPLLLPGWGRGPVAMEII